MSYNLTSLIDCATLQIQLMEITELGRNPVEPAPEIQFLTSAMNSKRVLEQNVVPGGDGKVKNVQVIYTPRDLEGSVSTTLSAACNSGTNEGMSSTTYTIDPLVGVSKTESINIADLAHICRSNPSYFASRIAAIIDVVSRKMQTQVASQMVLNAGIFATDNGESGLSVVNTLKTVATKFPAAVDGGKWNPEALQEIVFSTMNSGYIGMPFVFGFGPIWKYMNYLKALGNFSDGGLDFKAWVSENQIAFVPSMKMHVALNGAAGTAGKFLVVDPGSQFLLQYNRYADPLIQNNDQALVMNEIVDPVNGVKYNIKIVKNCAETIDVTVSTAFKVVTLPADMYQVGDRLHNVNGTLQFAVTNT